MAGQPGLFDLDERDRALSESGDPLIRLATLIDFEVFRAPLVSALKRSDGTRGGRPAYDPVLMFKVVVLQTLSTLSDAATEFCFAALRVRSATASRSCAFLGSGWSIRFQMPKPSGSSASS